MPNRTVTIRGLSTPVLKALHAAARANRRSLNSELLVRLEQGLQGGGTAAAPSSGPAVDASSLASVCRMHGIRHVAVFGSLARGEAQPDSDADVLVEFEPGRTPGFGMHAVAEALRPVFGGRRVDLVTRRGLSPRFRDRILGEAVTLYGA